MRSRMGKEASVLVEVKSGEMMTINSGNLSDEDKMFLLSLKTKSKNVDWDKLASICAGAKYYTDFDYFWDIKKRTVMREGGLW
ncbi:MAG: hypothetical protein Ta2A_08430 [Treponemataceae bacterium]|nr:MAG: hypothetical protein Ta2A_08430 [Treponemataceae bacterium]